MKQVEFIWKMKNSGFEVIQTTNTIVQVQLAPDVLLEHSTHINHTRITLVFDIGTDDEVDIAIDNNEDVLNKIILMAKAESNKDDFAKEFII